MKPLKFSPDSTLRNQAGGGGENLGLPAFGESGGEPLCAEHGESLLQINSEARSLAMLAATGTAVAAAVACCGHAARRKRGSEELQSKV